MKKQTRTVVIALSLATVLVLAIVVALPGIVALNKVKNEIAETLSQASGRPVTIGKLSLSLYPWLGIRLDGAELANAPTFGKTPLARVDDALVEVRVLPLFAGHIVLRRVVVTGLKLNLRENAAGHTNWAALIRTPKRPAPTKATRAEAHEAPAFALLRAAGLTVTNASVTYRNARTGARDILSHFTVRLGEIRPGRPVAVHLAGVLKTAGHGPFPFRLSARAIRQHKGLLLNPFRLSIATLKAVGTVQATETRSGLKAHGHLHIPAFAPRPLLAALGLSYRPSDPKALRTASGRLAFRLSPRQLSLAPFTIRFDQTLVTGRLVRLAHPLLYRVHLAISSLALAPYLPPKPSAPPAPQPVQGPGRPQAGTKTPSPLLSLPVMGTVTIGRLVAHGLTLTHVSAALHGRHGHIRLQPLTMDLYGGTFAGRLALKAAHPLPWRLAARLSQVHIGALLRALHMFPEFSGLLNAHVRLRGSGVALLPIEQSVSGRLTADMPRGALRGLDINFIAKDPKAVVGPHRLKKVAGTVFTRLHAQATIANSLVTLQALSLHTARAAVHGQGTMTLLPTKTLNTLLKVTLPSGLTVPVRVRGPIGHVHFAVSLNRLLSGSGKGLGSAFKSLGGRLKSFLGIH